MTTEDVRRAFNKLGQGLYWLFVEPHIERRERYRDYRKESRKLDRHNDQELIDGMDRDRYVNVKDVRQILDRVNGRLDFQFSSYDFDLYLKPYFRLLDRRIRRCEIECRINVIENLDEGARVKVGGLLDLLSEFDFPDGLDEGNTATEEVAVAVDPEFDEGTMLGRLQKRWNEALPLRTPSVDVEMQERETDRPLNIKRPLILAIGLAAKYRNVTRQIEAAEIPTFRETRMERGIRENRPEEPRYYRGQRIN